MTSKFVARFKDAIEAEMRLDIALANDYLKAYSPKQLARMGLAIINLVVTNLRTGLGGKNILELECDPSLGTELAVGSFKVGDIVRIDRMKGTDKLAKGKRSKHSATDKDKDNGDRSDTDDLDGVVVRISMKGITVSVDEDTNDIKVMNMYNNTDSSKKIWIVKLANSITYKRMNSTLQKLDDLCDKKNALTLILLKEYVYKPIDKGPSVPDLIYFNSTLNPSQRSAIQFAISNIISIIHGPPGTGKTYTIIELIKQLTLNRNERVLVCGPSNISVDTILERLSDSYTNLLDLIRIGHPARLLSLKHSLEVAAQLSGKEIIADIKNDIDSTIRKSKKTKQYLERKLLWKEIKDLRKELRQREKKVINDLISASKVVCCTLHGAGSYDLRTPLAGNLFDTIIIDEVSQSLEPQCWIPIIANLGAKRLVIAGDNMQLPPTVKSSKDSNDLGTLGVTLFDRLVQEANGNEFKRILNVQYRMNDYIMQFASHELYNGVLQSSPSVKEISVKDLIKKQTILYDDNDDAIDLDFITSPCIWYDTQGGEFPEKIEDLLGSTSTNVLVDSGSKFNEMEALVVQNHVKQLISIGVEPECIGIISPYSAQVMHIKQTMGKELEGKIEIASVDGFQGREKEIIILSLVRSNGDYEVGFLKDKRRLNVAMTRAKRQLCVVGDMEMLERSGVEYLKHWMEFVEQTYEIMYPDPGDLLAGVTSQLEVS